MPTYLHPGVYVEEVPSGVKPIEGVGTSTAAFIGYTTQGPVGTPELIHKWDDYVDQYGGLRDTGSDAKGDPMGHAVSAFYQNGGTSAYIVRLAIDTPSADLAAASGYIRRTDGTAVVFSAINDGTWGDGIVARLTPKASDPTLFTLAIGRTNDKGVLQVGESYSDVSLASAEARYIESVVNDVSNLVTVDVTTTSDPALPDPPTAYLLGTSTSPTLTTGPDLSSATAADRTISLALDGGTAFDVVVAQANYTNDLPGLAAAIQAEVRDGATTDERAAFTAAYAANALVLTSGTRLLASSAVVTGGNLAVALGLGTANGGTESTGQESWIASGATELDGGGDGAEPDATAYDDIFTAFQKHRDINIICLPGQAWAGTSKSIVEKAIAHAEQMRDRMVIIDPPGGAELETEGDVNGLSLSTSTYGVLYYPWPKVTNPFYNEETNPGVPPTVLVAPSGFAAGMWAKIDSRRGVWKAPAGVETGLLGVAGLQFVVEDGEQDQLNPLGVDCLRTLPGFGPVVWGARTLSTKADPEWRYVPVRRTAIFIERSIYNGIQWAVFEPNNHLLWSSLRTNIQSFMNGLFRSGAFQGEKASDAFFVRCGLGDTMTQADIDRGQVIVIVGFAPLKPAEFVIVRIQQKVGQQ